MQNFQYLFAGMSMQEIEEKLRSIVQTALCEKYGDNPDDRIIKRVEEEWAAMERCDFVAEAAVLYELTTWLKKNQYPYISLGGSGSSFILYLLGITRGNPLPPHQYCPRCKKVWWHLGKDGFDFPQDERCPHDNVSLLSDGHNFLWQTFFRHDNSCFLYMELRPELYEELLSLYASHWVLDVKPSDKPFNFDGKCVPYKWISLPNHLVLDFCLCDEISNEFYSKDMEVTSRDCYIMLQMWNYIIGCDSDYFDSVDITVDNFSDLISLYGFAHSTGIWNEAAKFMISGMGYSPSDLIVFQEDIHQYLAEHGFSESDVSLAVGNAQAGHGLPTILEKMPNIQDKWSLFRYQWRERNGKMMHLLSKADVVEDIIFRVQANLYDDTHNSRLSRIEEA